MTDQPEGIPYWKRANISQVDFARVRAIALNLANIAFVLCKDSITRAEIAELRKLLGPKE